MDSKITVIFRKLQSSVFYILGDIFLINVIYFLVFYLRFDGQVPVQYLEVYYQNMLWITLIKILVLLFFKIYNNIWVYASIGELMQLAIAIIVANVFASSYIIAYITHFNSGFPRSIYVLALVFDVFFLGGLRFARRVITYLFNITKRDKTTRKRVMIVGAGEAGSTILREIRNNKSNQLEPVVAIDDDNQKKYKRIHGIKIAGGTGAIEPLAKKYQIDEIIIAMPAVDQQVIKRIISECRKTKCVLKILPDVYDSLDDGSSLMNRIRDVNIEDLLGRDQIELDNVHVSDYLTDKIVMVTGGGGSIGSELCRQIAKFSPERLVILDIYENNAYDLQNELKRKNKDINLVVYIASVRDKERIDEIIDREKPDVIFHAAAHKHVPLMEFNPKEALKNNVFGTYNTAKSAMERQVKKFVLISTDKAVNPTNVMGATKRICEMIIQSLSKVSKKTDFVAVRFGNVLGSNGSVIPLFKKQIEEGGPVTVTHPDIIRYFMTIPEAAQLVLQAGSMAKGGEIFVLDMGKPVKIDDLAKDLIRLSGLKLGTDIDIIYTGLRPGEKLYEELLLDSEVKKTEHSKIFVGQPIMKKFHLDTVLNKLSHYLAEGKEADVGQLLQEIVSTYNPNKREDEMLEEIAMTIAK